MDDEAKIDNKLFEYIANSRKKNPKYDITDVLVNRSRFINNEAESIVSANIDEMIRIKIASDRKIDVSNMEEVELMKNTKAIKDNVVSEFYNNLEKAVGSKSSSLDTALVEIKGLFSSLLNDEALAAKITDYLHKENSVTEFNDLKRLSQTEYQNVLRKNTNLSEQDIEKCVKSILASLA